MQRALDCREDPVRFTPGALLTRMATLAMHLVDEVLGGLPVEQGDEPGSLRPAVIPEHKEAAARRKDYRPSGAAWYGRGMATHEPDRSFDAA